MGVARNEAEITWMRFVSTLGMVQRQVALRTAVVDRVLDRHASIDFPYLGSTEHLHLLFETAQCFSACTLSIKMLRARGDLAVGHGNLHFGS